MPIYTELTKYHASEYFRMVKVPDDAAMGERSSVLNDEGPHH